MSTGAMLDTRIGRELLRLGGLGAFVPLAGCFAL